MDHLLLLIWFLFDTDRLFKWSFLHTTCLLGTVYVLTCQSFLNVLGLLDTEGLHIYALSLWQLGKNDLALSVTRALAAGILSMEQKLAAASVSLICRLLYYISGQESAITSILKMPKELFQSSKISFVVSAIHVLDQNDRLDAVVSSSRSSLASHEEITAMHMLIAVGKLVSLKILWIVLVDFVVIYFSSLSGFAFLRSSMDRRTA